jgi:hypothetical protein
MIKTKLLLISLLLFSIVLSGNPTYAQQLDSTKHSGEIWFGFQTITPLGDFQKKTKVKLGAGLDFGLLFNQAKNNDNIKLGFDIGIGYLEKAKDSIFKTNSNLYTLNLISRIKGPAQGRFMTYMDVIAGTKLFIVATHHNNNLDNLLSGNADYTTLESKTSSVISYGLGIGFKVIPKNKYVEGMLDFRCTFLKSGSMIYDTPYYTEKWVSQTNIIMPQISYLYIFQGKKSK